MHLAFVYLAFISQVWPGPFHLKANHCLAFKLRPSQRDQKSKQVCIYVVIVDMFRGEHYSPDRASGARPFQLPHQYEYTIGLLEIN